MNEAEKRPTNQLSHLEQAEISTQARIAEVEVIRDLVTPQESAASEVGDRSPTKTERPLPANVIEQTLGKTEDNDEDVETVRKPLSPKSSF